MKGREEERSRERIITNLGNKKRDKIRHYRYKKNEWIVYKYFENLD